MPTQLATHNPTPQQNAAGPLKLTPRLTTPKTTGRAHLTNILRTGQSCLERIERTVFDTDGDCMRF